MTMSVGMSREDNRFRYRHNKMCHGAHHITHTMMRHDFVDMEAPDIAALHGLLQFHNAQTQYKKTRLCFI